jgi:hypothetical protein
MTTNGKKKPEVPPPPIILILTLQPDGVGTLLTKRGDLASLSSFTFRGTKEIMAAIEHGAEHLIDVEQNPPPKDLPITRVTTPVPNAAPVAETEIENLSDSEAVDETGQVETSPLEAPDIQRAEEPSQTAQLNLF